jgi:hypothetical protein
MSFCDIAPQFLVNKRIDGRAIRILANSTRVQKGELLCRT